MSAGTRATQINKTAVASAIGKRRRKNTGAPQKPQGLELLKLTVALGTTDIDDVDDIVALCQFPQGTRLLSGSVVATDMDTHATPTLAFDITLSASATGTTPTVLINNSSIGTGGGQDAFDTLDYFGKDVSNLYLCYECEAAASTGAAGTLTVYLLVYYTDPVLLEG
jgi:hypothetical protein